MWEGAPSSGSEINELIQDLEYQEQKHSLQQASNLPKILRNHYF